MWVCTNKGFLSIVDKARTPGNDYLWRAEIPGEEVGRVLADQVMSIDYSNFKDSVHDHALHDAYFKVWRAMADLQEIPPYSRAR